MCRWVLEFLRFYQKLRLVDHVVGGHMAMSVRTSDLVLTRDWCSF